MFQSPLLLEASTFPPFSSRWFNKMDVNFPAKSHRKPEQQHGQGHPVSKTLLQTPQQHQKPPEQAPEEPQRPSVPPQPRSSASLQTGAKGFTAAGELAMGSAGREWKGHFLSTEQGFNAPHCSQEPGKGCVEPGMPWHLSRGA